jgi:hypothetical protein
MGGSRTKSVGGSSHMELGTRREWQGHKGFQTGSDLRRVKPYVQCVGIMREWGSPLEWSSRPPYMAGGLGLPFEVGGPSSGSVTD